LFFCGSAISEFGLNAFARKEPVFSRKCQPEAILRIIQKQTGTGAACHLAAWEQRFPVRGQPGRAASVLAGGWLQ
jgi:hypothetical protein